MVREEIYEVREGEIVREKGGTEEGIVQGCMVKN